MTGVARSGTRVTANLIILLTVSAMLAPIACCEDELKLGITFDKIPEDELIPFKRPRFPCVPTAKAPVIDGKLNDECWTNVGLMSEFTLDGMLQFPYAGTDVKMVHTAEALYIAVICYEYEKDKIIRACAKHDGPVEKDDHVEIFLDPGNKRKALYRLMVNASGTRKDTKVTFNDNERNEDAAWNAACVVKVEVTDLEWTVEIAIPFRDLGVAKPGGVWGVNVMRWRHGDAEGKWEVSTWIFGNTARKPLETLGEMSFEDQAFVVTGLFFDAFGIGENQMRVGAINRKGEKRSFSVEALIEPGEYFTGIDKECKVDEVETATCPFSMKIEKPAVYKLRFIVTDDMAGQEIADMSYVIKVTEEEEEWGEEGK